jgi:hypothetical protein
MATKRRAKVKTSANAKSNANPNACAKVSVGAKTNSKSKATEHAWVTLGTLLNGNSAQGFSPGHEKGE